MFSILNFEGKKFCEGKVFICNNWGKMLPSKAIH